MMDFFIIKDRDTSKKIKKNFLFSRILILIILFFSYITFKGLTNDNNEQILENIFLVFDSSNYLDIAINGYYKNKLHAFFPMLPIIIRCSLKIFNSFIPVIILNNILFYLTGVGIYNLCKIYYEKDDETALLISMLWYFSPLCIYSTVLYTESLFCFLSVCILYLFKAQKKPILLGILLGLLVCTRSPGSLLFFSIFICLFIDLVKSEKALYLNKFKKIIKIYMPATIISCIYPAYLQIKLNNWKYFVDVQYEYWSKVKSNILIAYIEEIKLFFSEKFYNVETSLQIEYIMQSLTGIFVLIILLILIIYTIKNKKTKKTLELLLFAIFTIYACSLAVRNVGVPSTSNYRYYLACISYYLLFENKLFLKSCIIINLFINVLIIISHSIGMFMY